MENKPVGSTERTAADPDMKRRMGKLKNTGLSLMVLKVASMTKSLEPKE